MNSYVYLNSIGTAVPPYDGDKAFVDAVLGWFPGPEHDLLAGLLGRRDIEHRYACVTPEDIMGHVLHASISERMRMFKENAFTYACAAVREAMSLAEIAHPSEITHLVIGSCTGVYSPYLHVELIRAFNMSRRLKVKMISFMGCSAAIPVLEAAYEIVKSDQQAVVLTLNIELCSLHMMKPKTIDEAVGLSLFADGAAATVISSKPGLMNITGFNSLYNVDCSGLLTWNLSPLGFSMELSRELPKHVAAALPLKDDPFWGGCFSHRSLDLAIHPGGRKIIDRIKTRLGLSEEEVSLSREVLRDYGNMSSATVLFILRKILHTGKLGRVAVLAAGPGLHLGVMHGEIFSFSRW